MDNTTTPEKMTPAPVLLDPVVRARPTAQEAIVTLEKMQSQIIHGKRTFGDIADVIRELDTENKKLRALLEEQTVEMERCPNCVNGQWECECCNGANGCDCKGQPVQMGRCNVCGGSGQIRADRVGVDTQANCKAIRGRCFLGSGPTSGYWAGRS